MSSSQADAQRPDPRLRDSTRDEWAKLKPLAREMRRQPTPAEDHLWGQLRDRRLANRKFRRQYTIGPFVVDFCCLEASVVVEVDGSVHDFQPDYDAERQRYLEARGFRVLRFSNTDVLHATESVCAAIVQALEQPHP